MAYQVPWTASAAMSVRVSAGVNRTAVGKRSASSWITWLLKTTSPVSFMLIPAQRWHAGRAEARLLRTGLTSRTPMGTT